MQLGLVLKYCAFSCAVLYVLLSTARAGEALILRVLNWQEA